MVNFARKRFIFADDRHRPECQHGLRIELARQLAQQIRFFDRQMRRNHRRQSAIDLHTADSQRRFQVAGNLRPFDFFVRPIRFDFAQMLGGVSRRRLPVAAGRRQPLRFDLPLRLVQIMKAVAPFVAHPPFIDERIFLRRQAINRVLIFVDANRATGRATGAHAQVPLHEPDALLVEKILIAQRPDRAQIDHAARQFVRQRIAGKHVDFLVAAAIDDHQFAACR